MVEVAEGAGSVGESCTSDDDGMIEVRGARASSAAA